MYIVLLTLQDRDTPLHLAAKGGHTCTTCVEHLLSTPGIDVNIKNKVVPHSWFLNNQYSRGCM